MNKMIVTLLLAAVLPLSGCAQKKTAATAAKPQLPAGVEVVQVPMAVQNSGLLDAIKAPYKGKVVVIDFWATWCGPCRAAMVKIDPIKDKYLKAKKPVAFVYVTGETSPKADWNAAIKNIKGYHYYLTNSQYKAIMGSLGIQGIPTYMIVGKDGKVSYDNIQTGGYPGDETITAEIDKALK